MPEWIIKSGYWSPISSIIADNRDSDLLMAGESAQKTVSGPNNLIRKTYDQYLGIYVGLRNYHI